MKKPEKKKKIRASLSSTTAVQKWIISYILHFTKTILSNMFHFSFSLWRRFVFKPKYWAKFLKYFFVLFLCLLVHHLAAGISLQFYILYKLLLYWSRGLQSGDPALLNGLSLWTYCFLIFWMLLKQGGGNNHVKTEKEKMGTKPHTLALSVTSSNSLFSSLFSFYVSAVFPRPAFIVTSPKVESNLLHFKLSSLSQGK